MAWSGLPSALVQRMRSQANREIYILHLEATQIAPHRPLISRDVLLHRVSFLLKRLRDLDVGCFLMAVNATVIAAMDDFW